MRINQPARHTGTWPKGEPQAVRDLADQASDLHCYQVYMVVIGGFETYEVIAVFEDRATARQRAGHYNGTFACDGVERRARVEEISFYKAA